MIARREQVSHALLTLHRVARALAVAAPIALSLACAGAEVKQAPPPPPPPPPPVPVVEADPHALCAMQIAVDDARVRGRDDALRADLTTRASAAPDDRVIAYGAARAIENDQARWKAFKALEERAPGSTVAALGVCETYAAWKMDDQAVEPCAAAEAGIAGLALVDVARADLALRRARLDDAVALAERAAAQDAKCAPAHVVRARIESERGDMQAAREAWDRALAAAPECFFCAVERARLVERTDGAKGAVSAWELALKLEPANADVLERFAATLVGDDDARALAAYESALKSGSSTTTTLLAAATLAERTGDLAKAADYAEKAVAADATLVDGWRLLLAVFERRAESDGQERAAGELLRLVPDDARAHLVMARLRRAREDIVGALTHLDAVAARVADAGLSDDEAKAFEAERAALRAELAISDTPITGDANSVVNQVQKVTRGVYERRLKAKRGLRGTLEVVVRTRGDGSVEDVAITNDQLGDPFVAASVVGNLRAARIIGKAQRLTIKLVFE